MKGKSGKYAASKAPAKKMKGGGLSDVLTQLSPAAMLIKGEIPKMGLLGMGYGAYKKLKDKDSGVSQGKSPEQVKADMGLRGGGLARKGTGAALRGGGIARKGTGAALKGGGIARRGVGKAMADGGAPEAAAGLARRPVIPGAGGQTNMRPMPSQAPAGLPKGLQDGLPKGLQGRALPPGLAKRVPQPSTSASSSQVPWTPGTGTQIGLFGQTPILGSTPVTTPTQSGSLSSIMSSLGSMQGMKKGGKVAKYAKGGAVKMTAGAGSGSGRLEKVSAHKSSPRVKAVGLKKGGKVRGK